MSFNTTPQLSEMQRTRVNNSYNIKDGNIVEVWRNKFYVKSSNGLHRYNVILDYPDHPNGYCTCDDFYYNLEQYGLQCKHIIAVNRKLNNPVDSNKVVLVVTLPTNNDLLYYCTSEIVDCTIDVEEMTIDGGLTKCLVFRKSNNG